MPHLYSVLGLATDWTTRIECTIDEVERNSTAARPSQSGEASYNLQRELTAECDYPTVDPKQGLQSDFHIELTSVVQVNLFRVEPARFFISIDCPLSPFISGRATVLAPRGALNV